MIGMVLDLHYFYGIILICYVFSQQRGILLVNYNIPAILAGATALFLAYVFMHCCKEKGAREEVSSFRGFLVHSFDDVYRLFPSSETEIKKRTAAAISDAQHRIEQIVQTPAKQRTFANTVKALDNLEAFSELPVTMNVLCMLESVSPEEAIRNAAHKEMLEVQNFAIEHINNNVSLYVALKEYAESGKDKDELTDEERYYLIERLRDFKRTGLDLPQEQQTRIKEMQKELAALTLEFDTAIAKDATKVLLTREELEGLPEEFINGLEKNKDGTYNVGIDYPTYFPIMQEASVESTRKKMSHASSNKAYPENHDRLKQIIAKRDALAKELGFSSYAALDLDDQMVPSPERAKQFLTGLINRVRPKVDAEIARIFSDLPESVTKTEDGRIKPWDTSYVQTQYKKTHFDIDEQELAEYFPVDSTIKELFDIYEQFLSVTFKQISVDGLWHPDVTAVAVYDAEDTLLGYFLLDLYPRPNKYSHACHGTVIPATYDKKGEPNIALSVVIANFPKPVGDKPALLKRNDVQTFFHEFGHALHALLGRTHIASFSGTSVKRDFVEMPSQMLEEWLWDKAMLKKVSSHYKTGEPMPDELIEKVLATKNISKGLFTIRQAYLSLLALNYFLEGTDKDPHTIRKQLAEDILYYLAPDEDSHFYASFGHLTGYGAKYYGYLWSKVFALDLFEKIKQHGLLNPEIGRIYTEEVIGRGGSKDPNQLLESFLGRKPNDAAFLKDIGVE